MPQGNAQQGGGQPGQIDFRNPQPPSSPENQFPQTTAGPQPQQEWTPDKIEDYALQLVANSTATGNPMSYADAYNQAQNQARTVIDSNRRIEEQQQTRQQNYDKISTETMNRAQQSGLIKNEEDKTVVQKLAYQARNAPDDASRWEYVRTGMRDFQAARDKIVRQTIPGMNPSTLWKKVSGSYQDKQSVIKTLQPALEKYKQYGLYDEARNDLITGLGLGPADAENALFPLSQEQSNQLKQLPVNKNKPKFESTDFSKKFPGEGYEVQGQEYEGLKNTVRKFINANPGINLLSMRTYLNEDKKYAWQDISKIVEELISEGSFKPDVEQDKQIRNINQSAIPGMAEILKYNMFDTR